MLREVIEWLGGRVTLMFMFLVVFAGMICHYIDGSEMDNRNLTREAAAARLIGLAYMIGGPLLYLALQIVMRVLKIR